MNHDQTFHLSALPAFTEGMARVLDLGATLDEYNDSPSPAVADFVALHNDWLAVGNDLRSVMKEYGQQLQTKS